MGETKVGDCLRNVLSAIVRMTRTEIPTYLAVAVGNVLTCTLITHLAFGQSCNSEGDAAIHIDRSTLCCNGDLKHKTPEQEGEGGRYSAAKERRK